MRHEVEKGVFTVIESYLSLVRSRLPEFCSRRQAAQAMDGLLSHRTLANLSSQGKAPRGVLMGKQVYYRREEFILWLGQYLARGAACAETEVSHD